MQERQYRVILKRKVKTMVLANAYLSISFSSSFSIGIPLAWIQTYGKHYILFKKEIGLAAEIGYPEFLTAIIREDRIEEDSEKFDKVGGPCLYALFIQKIVDAETGEQLWPKPAK